jgi:Holliday junction resolvase RusA-like endonuclease
MTNRAAEADAVTVGDLVEFQDSPQAAQAGSGDALTLTVVGTPQAQPRMRWVAGKPVSTAAANAKRWKAAIMRQAEAAAAFPRPWLKDGTPLQVDMVYRFGTDKSDRWSRSHTHKPDKDNLDKLTLDALVKAELIKDDAYISAGASIKVWSKSSSLIITLRPTRQGQLIEPSATPDWLTALAQPKA